MDKTSGNYKYVLTVKDRDFLNEWQRCIYRLYRKKLPTNKTKAGLLYSCFYSKTLCIFLASSFENKASIIDKYPADFVRGFFDSEGCVRYACDKGLIISANNTNKKILTYIKNKLLSLGLEHIAWYETKSGNKTILNGKEIITKKRVYEVSFSRKKDIQKFNDIVGFTILKKQQRVTRFLKRFDKTCILCGYVFSSEVQHRKYCKVCSAVLSISGTKTHFKKLKKLKQNLQGGHYTSPSYAHINGWHSVNRITLDIDFPEKLNESIKTIEQFGFVKNTSIYTSSSGIGKHVISWTEQGGYPPYQLLFIRHLAFDDPTRIILDAMTGRHKQVLFTKKKKRKIHNLKNYTGAR